MHVERYGTGASAYFALHGWSGDHRTFAPLVPYMPARASIYSADLPGYGKSGAPRSWDLDCITEEICAAVDAIDAERLTLVGNCSGAILSLPLARRLGARVRRFVMIDAFAYLPWYFRIFLARSFGRHAYMTTFANPIGRRLANLSLKARRTSETDLTGSFAHINHETTYGYLSLLGEMSGLDQFGGLKMPVDIAYGERTFGAVKESVAHWQRLWPHARAWQLGGAGHLPIEEATAQLGEIIFREEQEHERRKDERSFERC